MRDTSDKTYNCHLVWSDIMLYLISPYFSSLVSSPLTSHLILSHYLISHPIPFHLISSHLSHLIIWSDPIPSHLYLICNLILIFRPSCRFIDRLGQGCGWHPVSLPHWATRPGFPWLPAAVIIHRATGGRDMGSNGAPLCNNIWKNTRREYWPFGNDPKYFTQTLTWKEACSCLPATHYSDDLMSAMAFQITCVSMVCSTICSGAD